MTKTALLIVDVQKGFLNETTKHIPSLVEELISSQNYSLICATRFINHNNSPFVKWMGWKRFLKTETNDIELAFSCPNSVHIFDKTTYSSLTPHLLEILQEQDIDKIYLCGMDTNMCVFMTASNIFEHGIYEPFVLSKYCSSHSGEEFHEAGLMLLEKAIGKDHIL